MESAPVVSEERPQPETAPPWGLREVLMGLAFPFAVWAVALSLAIASGAGADDEVSAAEIIGGLVITLVMQAVFVALATGLTLGRYHLSWRDLGFRPFPSSLYWTAAAVAIGGQVLVATYAAIVAAVGADALAPEQGLESLFDNRALLPLVGVVTVLTTPLAEETFFRGFVFAGLLRRLGLPGAALVSGLLFAAFHVSSADTVGLVIPFAVIGVALAGLFYYTRSLWSSIAAHLAFNLISFIALAIFVAD